MAELTAVGKYIQFWWPEIPTRASAAVFFIAINAINLTNVKVFGEMEFWFAIIKVVAVVAMILFGGWLLFSGNGGPQATVRNLWDQGLPAARLYGLVMMMAIIMFSFGGWSWWGSPPRKRIIRSKAFLKPPIRLFTVF